jgi:hypothetical protein
VNTDEFEYGGKFSDLKDCVSAASAVKPKNPPAIIHKDIIIHPIQVHGYNIIMIYILYIMLYF